MILEEGNRPNPRCPHCDVFVSHKAINDQHMVKNFCWRGSERKRRCLAEENSRSGNETAITSSGTPLSPVTSFKYLGGIITAADVDWTEVVRNLRKASRKWALLTRLMVIEGVDAQTLFQI